MINKYEYGYTRSICNVSPICPSQGKTLGAAVSKPRDLVIIVMADYVRDYVAEMNDDQMNPG